MKRLIPIVFALLVFAIPAIAIPAIAQPIPEPEPEPSPDVCLKLTGIGDQGLVNAQASLIVLGLRNEMLRRDDAGDLRIAGYTNGPDAIAIQFWERPKLAFAVRDERGKIITPAVFSDRPYLRIRPVSNASRRAIREKIIDRPGALPAGLEKVPCPATRIWAGD